jgi:hypothetical protein
MIENAIGMYGERHKVVRGWHGIDRLYIHHSKGKHGGYYVTTCIRPSLDSMVEIAGEYWFRTLAELQAALEG